MKYTSGRRPSMKSLERESNTDVFRWNLRNFSYTFFTEHLRTTASVYKIPRSCIMVCGAILNPHHFITKFMALFPYKYRIPMCHLPILYFFSRCCLELCSEAHLGPCKTAMMKFFGEKTTFLMSMTEADLGMLQYPRWCTLW